MRFAAAIAVAMLAAPLAGCATIASRGIPVVASGGVLTERTSGLTLYIYDRDVGDAGKSACAASCLGAQWKPLAAAGNAKGFKTYQVANGPDGTPQWAYKGKPLYRYAADVKPGERGGDGFANLWRVAKP